MKNKHPEKEVDREREAGCFWIPLVLIILGVMVFSTAAEWMKP